MQKVKISKRVGRQLYRSSPTILTVVASVGVVTTTIMAVRATPKAIKILKEAELGIVTGWILIIIKRLWKMGWNVSSLIRWH